MNKELIVHVNPRSYISDSIKMIRTNVEYCRSHKNTKTLLITSSMPAEGKSFISSNLAIAFAQLNKKTLIIDCDLRKGRVHHLFGKENLRGLADILKENEVNKLSEYIINSEIKNLDLITRGNIPFNPSELLTYKVFDIIMEDLKDKYDMIILDGPPTVGLPDALVMAKKTDMVGIVTALGGISKELLVKTRKSLQSVDANIIGVIVNKVPKEHEGYYKYE